MSAKTYTEEEIREMRLPLGLPVIRDRVVQCAVKLIIEPIFEADFYDCSYGFRPNLSAQQAVEKVCAKVKEEAGSRKLLRAVDGVIERLNLVLDGWGRCFQMRVFVAAVREGERLRAEMLVPFLRGENLYSILSL